MKFNQSDFFLCSNDFNNWNEQILNTQSFKIWMSWGHGQMVKCLPGKHEDLSSNSSTAKIWMRTCWSFHNDLWVELIFKAVLSAWVLAGFRLLKEVCIHLGSDKVALFLMFAGVFVQPKVGISGKGGASLGTKSCFSEGLDTMTLGTGTWEVQGVHSSH
jgi:hypothetical protein